MGANRLSRQSNHTETTMRYLLGTLSEEERDRFEEMYFSDDAAFEEVEIAEGELIDRYVRGELAKSDHARFEAVLAASPRLGERVQFARVWKDKLAASSANQRVSTYKPRDAGPSWWARLFGSSAESRVPGLALAFGVLLVFVGGGTLFAGWLRMREESSRLDAQQAALEQRQRELDQQAANLKSQAEQLAKQNPPQPLPTETPQPKQVEESNKQSVLAVTLFSGVTRSGGGGKDIRVSPETRELKLTLSLQEGEYVAYKVSVSRVGGGPVFPPKMLRPQRSGPGSVLVLRIPGKLLSPGDYSIHIDGRMPSGTLENADDYSFRVIK
jgi:hypothetical protein